MTQQQPKPWWKPLARLIVDEHLAGKQVTYPMVGDLIVSMETFDFGMDRKEIRNALYGACRSSGKFKGYLLASMPDRKKGANARVFWRHMQFALGHNTNLFGVIQTIYETDRASNDVLQDVAFLLADLKGGNKGAEAWRKAIYG